MKHMALKWGEGQRLKEALAPEATHHPAVQLLLRPILQARQFPGRAPLAKHVQQLKALTVLLDTEEEEDEANQALILASRADCAVLRDQQQRLQRLLAAQSPPQPDDAVLRATDGPGAVPAEICDEPPAAYQQLGPLFVQEMLITTKWAQTASQLSAPPGDTEPDNGTVITEAMLYILWEQHEQEASEVQLGIQVTLGDLLEIPSSSLLPTAPTDSSPTALPPPSSDTHVEVDPLSDLDPGTEVVGDPSERTPLADSSGLNEVD
eukprot:EG_transcript_22867